MVDEIDIWRVAKLAIEKHGEGATAAATRRVVELVELGDLPGAAVWREVRVAILSLRDGPETARIQAELIGALKSRPAIAAHLTPEIEGALFDPDPAVRIRAGLPLCHAVAGTATGPEEREAMEALVEEIQRIIGKSSH